jgi:hypothetical protein
MIGGNKINKLTWEKDKLSWRDVLDSNHNWHGDIYKFFKVVNQTGYKYFSWNGWVYKVVENGFEKINVLVEEVE